MLANKPIITDDSATLEPALLRTLMEQISTLASVYHKPADTFVSRQRLAVQTVDSVVGRTFEEEETSTGGAAAATQVSPPNNRSGEVTHGSQHTTRSCRVARIAYFFHGAPQKAKGAGMRPDKHVHMKQTAAAAVSVACVSACHAHCISQFWYYCCSAMRQGCSRLLATRRTMTRHTFPGASLLAVQVFMLSGIWRLHVQAGMLGNSAAIAAAPAAPQAAAAAPVVDLLGDDLLGGSAPPPVAAAPAAAGGCTLMASAKAIRPYTHEQHRRDSMWLLIPASCQQHIFCVHVSASA